MAENPKVRSRGLDTPEPAFLFVRAMIRFAHADTPVHFHAGYLPPDASFVLRFCYE